jgi:hypothetical protein
LVSPDHTIDFPGVLNILEHNLASLERCFSETDFKELKNLDLP